MEEQSLKKQKKENKNTCLPDFKANKKTAVIKTVQYYRVIKFASGVQQRTQKSAHTKCKDLICSRNGTEDQWKGEGTESFQSRTAGYSYREKRKNSEWI